MNSVTPTTAIQVIDGVRKQKEKIYCIAATRAEIDYLARQAGVALERMRWLHKPSDLDGLQHPKVLIFPNWWRKDYTDMEPALQRVEADIHVINLGPQPRYKSDKIYLPR